MIKRHLLIVLLMLVSIMPLDAGTWKLHSYYIPSGIQNVYDTGDMIYYLNSNCLFRFDKATQITTALNNHNLLSDQNISQIYYDSENKLLFVAYANSNIDVIDSQGQVRNISGLKDAIRRVFNYTVTKGVLTEYTGKTINDITFTGGMAYASVGYGYIVIDESTLCVVNDYVLGQKVTVNSVAVIGNMKLVLTNGNCYYGPVDEEDPVRQFPKYTGSFAEGKFFPIDDHSVFVLGSTALYHFDFS